MSEFAGFLGCHQPVLFSLPEGWAVRVGCQAVGVGWGWLLCIRLLVDPKYFKSFRFRTWDITPFSECLPWTSAEILEVCWNWFLRIDLSGAGVGAHGYKAAGFLFFRKPAVCAWSGSLQFCFSWWSVARAAMCICIYIYIYTLVKKWKACAYADIYKCTRNSCVLSVYFQSAIVSSPSHTGCAASFGGFLPEEEDLKNHQKCFSYVVCFGSLWGPTQQATFVGKKHPLILRDG